MWENGLYFIEANDIIYATPQVLASVSKAKANVLFYSMLVKSRVDQGCRTWKTRKNMMQVGINEKMMLLHIASTICISLSLESPMCGQRKN